MPRKILMLTALSALIEILLIAVWVAFAGWQPVPELVRNFATGFWFAFLIGGIAWIVMPPLVFRIWGWRPALRWTAVVAALLVCALAGTAVVSSVLYSLGVMRAATIRANFLDALRTTVLVTLIAGVLITLTESARKRLQHTELELRTQQLGRERAEKLAAEARLASLTSRVQPHFLFNTLNSISALVRDNPAEAEQTIERLSSLLRASLDGAATVPLAQELKLVSDYLEIQQTRFGGRLRYQLSAAADAVANVPPFAVQSVVENALKHVGGRRREGVAVQVAARRSGADLLVDVTDNGPGFDPGAMTAGHGLDTLQGRLRALYGERAGLEFLKNSGTMTVRLRVPAI